MTAGTTIDPKLDILIERFIDAPVSLVWKALTQAEHVKQWWMPRTWGTAVSAELDMRPGGIFSIDILVNGNTVPNVGCILEVVPEQRWVWTSMLFPDYRPAVFDDVPITGVMTVEAVGTGTRYKFLALHRNEADVAANRDSGWLEGTELATDQLVELVMSLK